MMGTRSPAFATLADLAAWCERAPAGTNMDAQIVAEMLRSAVESESIELPRESIPSDAWTWREKLWTVPAETRLGVVEVAEALARPRSFVYAHTGKTEDPIPHRKLDGVLTFAAGELRAWIREREDVIAAGPMESTEAERRGHLRAM